MRSPSVARGFFALTGVVVVIGLVVQLVVAIDNKDGHFSNVAARVFNLFCFFTVQSNVLVAVTCLLLAVRLDRPSTVFRVVRICAVLGITLTFVIFHLLLSGLFELQGSAAFADFVLHTVSPLLCVLGWLVFGPRGMVDRTIVVWSLAFPVLWSIFTLVRGALITYYPYPFIDVSTLGYGQVAINCVLVGAVFIALASGAYLLDGVLDRSPQTAAAEPTI